MVQPPPGERSQQPMSGPRPPYDPSQPFYRQPAGPPPYGQPVGPSPYGAGYYPPQPKRRNGFAIAGVILAFIPIVLPGLIFSIIGLIQSKARAGAGKTLSIVGIALSLVIGGGVGTAVGIAVSIVASSPAADPGCISAESAGTQMSSTLNADEAAMTKDQNDSAAERTDVQHFITDMRSLQQQFSAAKTEAIHQSVKTQIAAFISDANTFTSALQAIEHGDLSKVNQMTTTGNKLESDGNTIDSTCSTL